MLKNKIKFSILSFSILSSLAFKIGDEVELTQFLNARTRPSFIKSTPVAKTLKTGTTGQVADVKRFYSGNMGIKMKLTSGPYAGKTYWVYYNKKSPGMTLTNDKREIIAEDDVDETLVENNEDVNSRLDDDTNGNPDPSETMLTDTADYPRIAEDTIREVLNSTKPPCLELLEEKPQTTQLENGVIIHEVDLSDASVITNQPLPSEKPEQTQVAQGSSNTAPNTRPVLPFDYPTCSHKDSKDFQTCYANNKVEQITMLNYGPNKINPQSKYHVNRTFTLTLNDQSLSDPVLSIIDNPNDKTSSSTYSMMMFFPRKQVPTVTSDGKNVAMTLSNGEVVTFDAKTKEINGGVMKEGRMQVNAKNKALPAKVSYEGAGVMIRGDRNNGLPFGNDEDSRGNTIKNPTIAVISKKGFKDCTIPSADLWYNDKSLKRTLIRPEYSTDRGLDKLLKSRCQFTIN